jgi:hypothetical protein
MVEAEAELPEDPNNAGMGKFYKPQTPHGKAIVKMFHHFCDIAKRDANAIVVYFGVYSVAHLALSIKTTGRTLLPSGKNAI